MKSVILIPIIIGSVLLVAGGTVFAIAARNSYNAKLEATEYVLDNPFTNIDLDISTAEVEFKISEGDAKKVVFYQAKKEYLTQEIKDDTLYIKQKDARKWYEKMAFSKSNRAIIYLPAATYGSLKLEASTGDVTIPNNLVFTTINAKLSTGDFTSSADANEYNIKVSTGKITLNGVKADNITANASTGDVTFTNTVVTKHIEIETSTGDITLNDSDAETLNLKASTGDVKGTLLTSKRFVATSSTGKINVPMDTDGGLCQIKTSTGNITFSIKK